MISVDSPRETLLQYCMATVKLHDFQKTLLRSFAFSGSALRFNDLLIEGLESEHMNYHLQKLIEYGFVHKIGTKYSLTDTGKDYANLMDDTVTELEKQPKTSVLLTIARYTADNKEEFLFSKRQKQPYFGKVGLLGGKVRFGESLEEAVRRELYEETGLEACSIRLLSIYHKIRKRENGEVVQDVLFYRFFVTDISGVLIEKTPSQINFWATKEDVLKRNDLFDTFIIKSISEYEKATLEFNEDIGIAQDF